MRISDSNDLGEALQGEFGGALIIDTLGNIQVTGIPETSRKKIEEAISNYYTKTLKCEDVSTDKTSEHRDLFFENSKGYEAIGLTYTKAPLNRILISILDMNENEN